MVYFGERRFRGARRGMTGRERVRLLFAVVLLGVLIGFVYSDRRETPEPPLAVPVVPRESAPASPARGTESSPSAIGEPREIPGFEPNRPADPFDPAAPSPLAAVRDDEIAAPGEAEQAGLIWLFHRLRAGTAVPLSEAVPWAELPARKREIRGQRQRLYITLVEEPIPRSLPDNPSGVRRYWEAFGVDGDGHMLRLQFIDKPRILPADSEVVADADFLRLYRYQMISGGEGIVPEWVASEVRLLVSAPGAEQSWRPFIWAGGISLILLLVVVRAMVRAPLAPRPRRPRRTTAPSPPDAGA